MALIPDSAVTLQRLDYAESSQVIVFFTHEQGRVRAIAKGIKRSTKQRFAVGIDLLEIGEAVFSVRRPRQEALAILTEWKQCVALSGLRQRLARLHAAQYACEISAALTEDWDPHPGLYAALVRVLMELCETEEILGPVVRFQHALLREIGLSPQWAACVSCRRPPNSSGEVYFSSFEGGPLCRDCEAAFTEKRALQPDALRLLQARWAIAPALEATCQGSEVGDSTTKAVDAALRGAFDVLNYHLAYQMGRQPLLAAKLAPPLDQRAGSTH